MIPNEDETGNKLLKSVYTVHVAQKVFLLLIHLIYVVFIIIGYSCVYVEKAQGLLYFTVVGITLCLNTGTKESYTSGLQKMNNRLYLGL